MNKTVKEIRGLTSCHTFIDLIIFGVLLFIKKKLPEYDAMLCSEDVNSIRILGKIEKLQSPL